MDWATEKEKINKQLQEMANKALTNDPFSERGHENGFDEICPICLSDRRLILEKWYVKREKTTKQLATLFNFTENTIQEHCRAFKLGRKRGNNTQALINIVLDKGEQALLDGSMEITMKDLAWAITHRDKLLGRIVDKQKVEHAPVVHIHTSIPGVGGISNKDVEEKKALENREPVLIPAVVLERTDSNDK